MDLVRPGPIIGGSEFVQVHKTIGEMASELSGVKSLRRRFVPRSRITLVLLDLVFLAGIVIALIQGVRTRLGFDSAVQAQIFVFCLVTSSIAFAFAAGCYRYDALTNFSTAVTRLVVALAVSAFFLIPIIHFGLGLILRPLAVRSLSREMTIIFLAEGASITGGILSRLFFLAMARRHWFRRSILVVGTRQKAAHIKNLFSRSDRYLAKLHFLDEEYLKASAKRNANHAAAPLSGVLTVEDLGKRLDIDQVVIAIDAPSDLYFDRLLPWKANGIPVFDFSTFLERETGKVDLNWTDSDWLLFSEGFRFGYLDLFAKRLVDLLVSAVCLLITLPTLLLVAAAIVIEDQGPIFYRQERVTQNGRIFWILKFRTMRADAEKFGACWATENDPRITLVGRFLRRSRIDEVPQLINVLRGDMALVGPRPERPVFVEKLSEEIRLYNLRHSVKAGITGWAQINHPYGASVEDAKAKLEYDLYYLKHFSILRDLSIMLQTFRVLVFAQGGR